MPLGRLHDPPTTPIPPLPLSYQVMENMTTSNERCLTGWRCLWNVEGPRVATPQCTHTPPGLLELGTFHGSSLICCVSSGFVSENTRWGQNCVTRGPRKWGEIAVEILVWLEKKKKKRRRKRSNCRDMNSIIYKWFYPLKLRSQLSFNHFFHFFLLELAQNSLLQCVLTVLYFILLLHLPLHPNVSPAGLMSNLMTAFFCQKNLFNLWKNKMESAVKV